MTRQQFFPLVFIALASGMAVYFSLAFEPSPYFIALLLIAGAPMAWRFRRAETAAARLVLLTMVASFGFAWAQLLSLHTAAKWQQLALPSAGEERLISGHIIWSEPRARGSVMDISITQTKPYRLRIFAAKHVAADALPGCHIEALVFVAPIGLPISRHAYDRRFTQFFAGRQGQGFLRRIDKLDCQQRLTVSAGLARWRLSIAQAFRQALPPPLGALAASLVTGIRGAIPADTRDLFRDTGLAHVLAISGLHMGLFAGSVFAVLRLLAASWPWLVQSYDVRRLSAGFAIIAAIAYLIISGASFATQRAFMMIVIVFFAMLLGRAGLTLRNLSTAGIVISILQPAAVMQAGFQMSFAAVMALIAYYEYWQSRNLIFQRYEGFALHQRLWRYLRLGLWGLFSTSLIAGGVTGYIAAYHFGQMAGFGLLTNILAMPIFSLLVMPMAALSLALLPLGLHTFSLSMMGWGLAQIIAIAQWVASNTQAVWHVAPTPPWALICAMAGLILLALGGRRERWLALLPIFLALMMLGRSEKPVLAIVQSGDHIMAHDSQQGLRLIRQRGNPYQAQLLQDYWRLTAPPASACKKAVCAYQLADGRRLALVIYRHGLTQGCNDFDIVVAPRVVAQYPCQALLLDKPALTAMPNVEIYPHAIDLVTPNQARYWNRKPH